MEKFFEKIEAIAASLNIQFKRETPVNDTLDSAAFTLDGIAYCISRNNQAWQACGDISSQPEDLVGDVLLTHLYWRLQYEELKYGRKSTADALEARRREAIQRAFEDYNFGEKPAECSGWEFDGLDTYKRAVFIEQESGPSRQVTFYVEFKHLSDEIAAAGDL